MKYSWNKSFNSIHLHGLSAQRVLEKDTVSAFKDFDNSVRMIETCPRNYNAKQNVKNSTADPRNERWNSAVWCSGFGVTQAGDGAHLWPLSSTARVTWDKVLHLTASLLPPIQRGDNTLEGTLWGMDRMPGKLAEEHSHMAGSPRSYYSYFFWTLNWQGLWGPCYSHTIIAVTCLSLEICKEPV